MNHMRTKLVVASMVLVLALSYLAYASVKKGWVYYLQVDAFLADAQYRNQRVRLCGTVADEGVAVNAAKLSAEFKLQGETKSVPVAYHGVIPDLFKAGCEVVVEGTLNDAGVFQADTMLTKCASKYHPEGEPESGTAPKSHPNAGHAEAKS